MKKLFSYTLALLASATILFSCSSREVAELQKTIVSNSAISTSDIIGIKENNNYRITCSINKLKEQFEDVLKKARKSCNFSEF